MDEEVINDLYARAQGLGYQKGLEDFVTLLNSDDEVLQDNFSYVQEQGYSKGLEDFSVLIGRKKKEPSALAGTPPSTPEQEQVVGASVLEEEPEDNFDKSLEFVNDRLIDRSEAGQTARELEYEFGDYGFTFDRGFELGIGNYITATSDNGETIDINTNPQFLTNEGEQANLLRNFLVKNRGATEKLKLKESIESRVKEMQEANGAHQQAQASYNVANAQLEKYAEEVKLNPEIYSESEHRRLVNQVNESVQADEEAVNEYNALLSMQEADLDAYKAQSRGKGEEMTALERTFGKNAVTDFISDNTYRAVMQGQAQAGTIRSSYNLTVNANDVTDEEIQEFLRAQAVLEENGPSDEMRDFQRRYQKEGGGWGGFIKSLFSTDAPPLAELFVSSVSMMANKEVLAGSLVGAGTGAAIGSTGFSAGPLGVFTTAGGAIAGAMGGAGASLEAGISFAEFLRDEMAIKQGVDSAKVVMNNDNIREVLSDGDAMARIRMRQSGRGIAIGVTSMIGTAVAANVTRRTAIATGNRFKAAALGALAEMPFEGLGEASGRLVAAQEMDAAEIGLESLAGGPAQVVGVGMGLFKSPEYTLNGELVTGKQMADFIREADEADVAGATIEIKNDDILVKEAHGKRDDARQRVIIKEQLRQSGVEDQEQVDALAELELEKRKLKGLETTSARRRRERIQNEIDAILDGDSYFFEETTDENGNKRSKEVRVTRREAVIALLEDDVANPTEKEIEAKQAELFQDAMADIQESDAVQEPSTEEVSPRDESGVSPEMGEEVQDEQEVAVEDAEAEELGAAFDAESTPDVEEDIDGVRVRRREGYQFGKKAQRVLDQAKRRVKSLENFGVNIVLHENDAQYGAATGKSGSGVYLTEVDAEGNVISKTIHINLDKANSRTVAHEAFHALFLERVKGDDAKAQQWAKATMKSVRKALDADSVLATRIDSFLNRYEENIIDEEALAEIFGYLSEGYGQLSGPQQSSVKTAIKKLIELFGIKLESQWSQEDQNVIDVLNTLSGKMERGETITEEELSGLDVSEEKAEEVAEETTVDNRVASLQEKRATAERENTTETGLSELDEAIGRTGDSAAQRVYNAVFKSVRTGKLRAIEKQIRDANKSKKMSAEDKVERINNLEENYNTELERISKARKEARAKVDAELKRLQPKLDEAKKKEGLAEVKKKQAAITEQLSRDIREVKRSYEKGKERDDYIAMLKADAEVKRAALRDDIAELRGGKKKAEPTVEEEVTEVESTPEVEKRTAETKERIVKEKENLKTLKQKLAEAKRDLKEFEAREEKKRGRKERDNKKKAVADIESEIQESTKNIEELEAEVSSMIPTEVDTGTVRNRVGKEKYSAFETAVRDLLEYTDEVGEEPTRGQKNALTRRKTKVAKLVAELKLSPAEQAVVQSFVQERVNNKKEAEAKRKVEQEKNKAAAERGKKEDTLRTLNNQLVQATRELLKLEDVGATESMKTQAKSAIDAIKAEIDSLMADRPAKDESPVVDTEPTPKKKPKREYDPTVDKTTGRKLTDKELKQNEIVNKAFDRIKKLGRSKADITKRRYLGSLESAVPRLNGLISAAERTGDNLLVEDLRSVRANVGRAMNEFLDKTEGMSNEQVEAMEARFESPYYEFFEALKTENPLNAWTKTYVEALGKAGIVLYESSSTAEASPVLKELIEASEEIDEINKKLDKLEASSTEAKALRARQKELMRVASGEAIAEKQQTEAAEEVTEEQLKVERQRKETLSRQTQRDIKKHQAEVKKLKEKLKGKRGKERKPLRDAELRLKEAKEFTDNLNKMSVNEALRLRTPVPSAREQRVKSEQVAERRFDLSALRVIGKGSSRVVYDLGDGRALKVALNAKGLEQNQTLAPWDVESNLKGFVPLVFEEGPDYLVVENLPFDVTLDDGRSGASAIDGFIYGLEQAYSRGPGRLQEYLEEYKEGMGNFVDYEMLPGDFKRHDSWGIRKDGTIVLVDEGALNPSVNMVSEPTAWAVEDFAEVEKNRGYRGPRQTLNKYSGQDIEYLLSDPNTDVVAEEGNVILYSVVDPSSVVRIMQEGISSDEEFSRSRTELGSDGSLVAVEVPADAVSVSETGIVSVDGPIPVKSVKKAYDAIRFRQDAYPMREDVFRDELQDRETGEVADWAEELLEQAAKEGFLYRDTDGLRTAREQRVADVVERYDFRPNGSLRESSLAGELRRNLKRYGFGVKQFGTRMDDFHIVNLNTGRKVDPKKLIKKDRADEKIENEQRAEVEEKAAEKRLAIAEAEDLRNEELQQYRDQYQDFPEDMIPSTTLSAREQRESLQDNAGKFNDAALVKFAKERGYSDAVILKLRPSAQAAIDAYDAQSTRLSREVQGIIQKARARARGDKAIQAIENKGQRTRAVNDRIIKDVKAYIKGSKMYEEASDVGREAMIRSVDKQMGRRVKAAPSVIKLLGLTPDGDVVIDKKGLIEQIRIMARSSKATAAASREIMREVGKDIARLKATGTISGAKATAILTKMAKMDPFNPVQVENFVNYTARVFAEAKYIQEVNKLNKLRKRALSNASKKLGVAQDLMPMLQTLLNIDASLIPESVFKEYQKLVNELGERKKVLDLRERTDVYDSVVKILSGVNEVLAKKEELFARYEAFHKKGDSVASTIKDMVEQELLSEEEEEVLKKYADELKEERKMSEEEKEQAREEERIQLLDAVQRLPRLSNKFPTQIENKLVRRFNGLIRTGGVLTLSNSDLKNVLRVADNIQNGFLPHTAQVLVEMVEVNNRSVIVEQSIKDAKLPKIARVRALLDGVTNDTSIARAVNRNPLRFIDQVYGDYKTSRIYDAAFKDLASSYATYKSDIMGVQKRLDNVEQKLIKSLARNPNAVVRSKFLIGAYMMQAEFDANPNVPGVFDAVSLLDETIKKSDRSSGGAYYNEATSDVLRDIKKKIDGKSAEEIRDMLSAEEKAVADEIRNVNNELTPKAEYVAGVLRGVPFRPFSQYFHRIVLRSDDKTGLKGVDTLIDDAKARMRKPSTKAKNIQSRVSKSPPAVNFDPFSSARRGARYILTDYHMTEAVRTNARLMNKLEATEMTRKQRKLFNALNNASELAITDSLVQSYTISNWAEKAIEMAKRQGYRVVLADAPRMVGELLSNVLFVAAAAGKQFALGAGKYYKTMATNGSDVMRNVRSVQTTRLYADNETVSSRMVESLRTTTGPEKGDVGNAVLNRMKQIWAYSGAPWSGAVGSLADFMITTPDKLVSRPVWFGTFSEEFKAKTGEEVDFDKIAANDEEYMVANEEAIKAATDAADLTSVQVGATDNPFLGIASSFRKSGASAAGTLITSLNNYMTRFLVFEYVTARTAIKASVGNGTISPSKAVRLFSAVVMRMVAYVVITQVLRDMLDKLLGVEDDDEETFEETFEDAVRQSFVSLSVGATYGSLFRSVANTAIEFKRAEMMENKGIEYTYKDGVLMPLMSPAQDGRPYKKMLDAFARVSGPYNPMVRTGVLIGKLFSDSEKKENDAIKRRSAEFNRAGLEVLGLIGLVPLYKDIRRIYIKSIYKDIDKEETPETIEQRVLENIKKKQKSK